MRLFKAMLSVALVLVMICSCCAVSLTASAVTTKETPVATNPNLQDNIQDGVILHAFCWGYDDIKENLAAIESEIKATDNVIGEYKALLAEGNEAKIIEKAARERLGYVFEDEQVYVDISAN